MTCMPKWSHATGHMHVSWVILRPYLCVCAAQSNAEFGFGIKYTRSDSVNTIWITADVNVYIIWRLRRLQRALYLISSRNRIYTTHSCYSCVQCVPSMKNVCCGHCHILFQLRMLFMGSRVSILYTLCLCVWNIHVCRLNTHMCMCKTRTSKCVVDRHGDLS